MATYTVTRTGDPSAADPWAPVTLTVADAIGSHHSMEQLFIIAEMTDSNGNKTHEIAFSREHIEPDGTFYFYRGYRGTKNSVVLGAHSATVVLVRDGGWLGPVVFHVRSMDDLGNLYVGTV